MPKFPARLGSELRLGDGATPLADTLALGTDVSAGRPASALLRERLATVATCSSVGSQSVVGLCVVWPFFIIVLCSPVAPEWIRAHWMISQLLYRPLSLFMPLRSWSRGRSGTCSRVRPYIGIL